MEASRPDQASRALGCSFLVIDARQLRGKWQVRRGASITKNRAVNPKHDAKKLRETKKNARL